MSSKIFQGFTTQRQPIVLSYIDTALPKKGVCFFPDDARGSVKGDRDYVPKDDDGCAEGDDDCILRLHQSQETNLVRYISEMKIDMLSFQPYLFEDSTDIIGLDATLNKSNQVSRVFVCMNQTPVKTTIARIAKTESHGGILN